VVAQGSIDLLRKSWVDHQIGVVQSSDQIQTQPRFANELKNSSSAERFAEIERNPNVNKRGEVLNALKRDIQKYQDHYNKAIKNVLPEELAR
jgi:uncharacterized membrane-anchored protein YhcB (DUF1043 family)